LGRAAGFTQLTHVRRQLIELAGIDPHPGTVNLALFEADSQALWKSWRGQPGHRMAPGDSASCAARCYPVRVEGRIPAAIVLPEIANYPEHKVEFVAALPVREHLKLEEGARVRLELCRPLAAKAVLFDLDGTLVDSVGAYLEVARVAAKVYGLEVTELQVRQALSTGTNFWKGMVTDETMRQALFAHASREWPRILREHGTVFGGLAATLDALKRMGFALGIVSGARPEVLELLRDVMDRFDAVVLGNDVSHRKPHPEGLHKCLAKLGLKPEEALYVGDTPIDIQASRAAGMRSIGVLTGAGDSALLSAHEPDRLVASHVGLPPILQSFGADS
jgi:phosphoglycolate phosphatase